MIAIRMAMASIVLLTARTAFAQAPTVLKHDGWVAAVAFAPDGKTLASAGADNVVRLWEVGAWKPKGVLKGHTDCVSAVAFDPTSSCLVSGSYDHTAKFWRLDKLREIETLKGHKGAVTSVCIDFFGGIIYTASVDGTWRAWFGDISLPFDDHKSWVNSIAKHGIALGDIKEASGSSDGTVCLMVFDGKASETKSYFLEGGAGEVRCVAFSPNGKLLAAGNRYHTVRVWDVASRKEIKTLDGHMSDVWAIAFSPDGKTLATVDTDWKKPSKIRLYDTATWKVRATLDMPGEILCLAYSPKGDWLAAGSWDKTVRVFPMK